MITCQKPPELESRAGGNPSRNTGVNYVADLARSADASEVKALYGAAGLSLGHDVQTHGLPDRAGLRQLSPGSLPASL